MPAAAGVTSRLFGVLQVLSGQVHSEARVAGSAYIASFLARANFVSLESVLPPLSKLVTWARDYHREAVARLAGQPVVLDVHIHGVFYAVVQAALYLLCYKDKMLRQPAAAAGRSALAEQLHELLNSPLNPLKFCHDAVVHEFTQLDLCDCSQVLRRSLGRPVQRRDYVQMPAPPVGSLRTRLIPLRPGRL